MEPENSEQSSENDNSFNDLMPISPFLNSTLTDSDAQFTDTASFLFDATTNQIQHSPMKVPKKKHSPKKITKSKRINGMIRKKKI